MLQNQKKYLFLIFKIVVACGLIYLIYRQVHWQDYSHEGVTQRGLRTYFIEINPALAIPGLAGFVLSIIFIATRWKTLLKVQSIHIPMWKMIKLTFLGEFFNTIVPGTVGGDLVKAANVSKHTSRKATVWLSVFLDRTLGLASLAVLAIAMTSAILALGLETPKRMKTPAIAALGAMMVVTTIGLFLLSRRFRGIFHLQKIYSRLSIAKHLQEAGQAARLYRSAPGVLLRAVCLTIAAHLSWIGGLALLGTSLSLNVPIYAYFVYVPLIYIAGAVPTTPGGVGLVEGLFVFFFITVNPSAALALAVMARMSRIIAALPGFVVFLFGTKLSPSIDQLQSDTEDKPCRGGS